MIDAGLIAARFLHYVALALAFGAFAYGFYSEGAALSVGRRLRALAFWSSLGVLLAAGGVLVATVAGLGGSYAATLDSSLWAAIVQETDFGRVWVVRLIGALALVAIAGLAVRWHSTWLRLLGAVLAGALLASIALTGHAQIEEGAAGVLHRAADAIHLLATAAWIGALPPLLLLLGKAASAERPEEAMRRLQAFHAIGVTSVLLLVATGLINSWFLVGGIERLFTTRYGWLLLAKLGLFGVMIGLAAGNRRTLVPALVRNLSLGCDPSSALDRLRGHIRFELALGSLVLLIVAALGTIAPAVDG